MFQTLKQKKVTFIFPKVILPIAIPQLSGQFEKIAWFV